MLIRELNPDEKNLYNSVANHPLQSWEWGEFRKQTGLKVDRLGFFENGKLANVIQVSFHPIPVLNKNAGYFPRGFMPNEDQISALKQLAERNDALFIKMEPDIAQKVGVPSAHNAISKFLLENGAKPGRPLFTKYTFQLDLTKTEEELFNNLSSKTRYNVNLAIKKGVQIFENTTQEGMEEYIKILEETTKRQGFYAHSPDYFRKMWQTIGNSGMLRIFNAVYEGQILVSWVMFVFNNVLYYPYGASRDLHRDVMASNLMMWEMIRYGKKVGCTKLDMWGSLGPEPDEKNPWFGFHRFKKGYGGDLMEFFLGTYDYVINPQMYSIFTFADNWRWKFLRLKTKIGL
jgi:lipid II:glycine glycyltransferase (peptidoglycan interpeptide bridge formation enzyme)